MTVREAVKAVLDKWNSGEYKYGVPEPDPIVGNLEKAYYSEETHNRVVVELDLGLLAESTIKTVRAERPNEACVIIKDYIGALGYGIGGSRSVLELGVEPGPEIVQLVRVSDDDVTHCPRCLAPIYVQGHQGLCPGCESELNEEQVGYDPDPDFCECRHCK